MPVYISDALYTSFSGSSTPSLNPDSPRIGIQNITSISNINSSVGELPTNPSWLTSTPSTAERWKQESRTFHFWSADTNEEIIDYVGIAAHRGLVGRSIEISVDFGAGNVTVYGPVIVTDSSPILALFEPAAASGVTIFISSIESFELEIGIINVGLTVALPRNIYVDHTPITMGRRPSKLISNSDNGQFLGQIATKNTLHSSVSMANIQPDYFRSEIFPKFIVPAETLPFFWAWRPKSYPLEYGLCWTQDGVNVTNSLANGFMQMDFTMTGYNSNG
jgi:hypothetical protein